MKSKAIFFKEDGFRIFYVPYDFCSGIYGYDQRKKEFHKKNKKKQRNRSSYKQS